MFEVIIEIFVIIGIVALQGFIFVQNRQKIARLAELFPDKSRLRIVQEYVNASGETPTEVRHRLAPATAEKLALIEQGKKFLFLSNPGELHQVINLQNRGEAIEMKKTVYNGFTSTSETYYIPYLRLLQIAQNPDSQPVGLEAAGAPAAPTPTPTAPEIEIDVIAVEQPTPAFAGIVRDTNDYLRHNKGAAADFNILKDITERQSEVLESEIQATVATPLYIGLLGTFLGVILGLSGIIFGEGVSNESIQTFITGVVIAMVGSFAGLLFTLWGNNLFKNARFERDRLKNNYYTFLQARLLPKLHSDMATSLGNLKSVLDAFNKDFFDKVADFKPIIAGITENIQVQRDFLVKMEQVGYTQIANASVQVFDKVTRSTDEFQKFLGYQQALNKSLEMGDQTVSKIHGLLDRMINFEKGINHLGQYIGQHDHLIQKQLDFFGKHEREMEDISAKIEQFYDQSAGRLTELMDARMKYLEQDAQNAYERWAAHFEHLNQDNIYERIVQYLEPFGQLNRQQETMRQELNQTQRLLLEKIDRDNETQHRLLRQIEIMNQNLDKLTQPGVFRKMMNRMMGK